jgi:hypothetical protein
MLTTGAGVMSPEELIEAAARVLACRGYVDPHDVGEWPDELAAELAELAARGECNDVCPGWPSPDNLADHWQDMKQEEWERSWPLWVCACGRLFKTITEFGDRTFYTVIDDGYYGPPCPGAADGCEHSYCASVLLDSQLPGNRAGTVEYRRDGRVRHSSACPSCGRLFADVIADRARPQQALLPLPGGRHPHPGRQGLAAVLGQSAGPAAGGNGRPPAPEPGAPERETETACQPMTLF